jgi:hypothetical protein
VCSDVNEFLKIRRNSANGSEPGAGRDRDKDIDTPEQVQEVALVFGEECRNLRGRFWKEAKEKAEWAWGIPLRDRRSVGSWSIYLQTTANRGRLSPGRL